MSITSRRAVLAGLAATPALAGVPALAAEHPDAELLELGRSFDDLQSKLEAALELSAPRDEAYEAALSEMTKRLGGHASDDEYGKELKKVGEHLDRDFPKPSTHGWERWSDKQAPIASQIMALPATTLAGLAVKARAAQEACSHYWDESDRDCDWDVLMARKLIDAVLQFTGAAS